MNGATGPPASACCGRHDPGPRRNHARPCRMTRVSHHCPACGAPLPAMARHPWYICALCRDRITDADGYQLEFGNTTISGGFAWRRAGEERFHEALGFLGLLDGRPVRVSGARFRRDRGRTLRKPARGLRSDPRRRGRRPPRWTAVPPRKEIRAEIGPTGARYGPWTAIASTIRGKRRLFPRYGPRCRADRHLGGLVNETSIWDPHGQSSINQEPNRPAPMLETRPDASALLSSVFGFDGFRPGQADIVGRRGGGSQRAGHHADGWRQVPLFPAARDHARRRDRGSSRP